MLVLKKDETWKLCTDFRQLNNQTIPDSYRLPCFEETLDKLAEAKYKHKTAFFVPGVGFFEYNQMPFGLCNAGASFQVLYDVNNKICSIYLDDILIWSSTLEKHLERLDAVFKRLSDAELKLKPSKCSFFQDKIGYLGYIISSNGVETDPSKIEAVTQWGIPKNVDDIRKFLGFTGYYCRFVKDYAR